ncbi:MAG: transketolase [Actinobacteria bacterium]|nr:MAG: transketolase [Actinomycetota bacterium]
MAYGGVSARRLEPEHPALGATLGGKGLSTAPRGFIAKDLSDETVAELTELGRLCRGDILKMTEVANSGHPGGSCSSIDLYLVLYAFSDLDPDFPHHPERDRIAISHGHTSPGAYSALARMGFFDINDVVALFRKAGSPFEGHVDRAVPGIEWSVGNLGQGLSAGCGFALSSRLTGRAFHTYVCMSDGEQDKGQTAEARHFAAKYSLSDLTVLMDRNGLQMSGPTREIMPLDLLRIFAAEGWAVMEIDGHDYRQIYGALRAALLERERPVAVLANTVMGRGIPQIEGDYHYHGKPLAPELFEQAMEHLGLVGELGVYRERREAFVPPEEPARPHNEPLPEITVGAPRTYEVGEKTDNRTAWGRALLDIGQRNHDMPIAVLDCDVMDSTKVEEFAERFPDRFFQAGISEHNTAVVAGALSTQGVLTFFADFAIYGVDEPYNQQRLNGIQQAEIKTVCTHAGIDVGEDGKTHHSFDYLALARNIFGYKVIIPADPNQTDRVIRWVVNQQGPHLIAMGRSKADVIADEEGGPLFSGDYEFEYGKVDVVREGEEATIMAYGPMVQRAVQAYDRLLELGHRVRVLNVSCPKELSLEDVERASQPGVVLTYEDHHVDTGLGGAVALHLAELRKPVRLIRMGVWRFADSGKADEVYERMGLDSDTLVDRLLPVLGKRETLGM